MQVHVEKYPQLRAICWNRAENVVLRGDEVFALYERNWRFVDREALTDDEKALLAQLVEEHGPLRVAGVRLVCNAR
ncbi:hypothetical protein [Agrobacterium rosae]|uniref:hypothetical protein n=1 Tax=Agrobacterium rosae TaxID=1972867 RepID=UPI003B9EB441